VRQKARNRSAPEEPALLIRRAEELGRTSWTDAIGLLETANRRSRSDAVEIALAAMRHRAFSGLDRGAAAPAARGTSPAVGDAGLPEADLADLSPTALRGAILEHGAVLVRGALARRQSDELAEAIERGFAATASGDGSTGAGGAASAWFAPLQLDAAAAATLGRRWVRGGGGLLLADSPRLLAEILDLYDRLGLRSLVADYLGTRPVISANKCTLRRVSIASNGDWHQDGSFLGRGIGVRAINIWLTLTPCGVDAPGLDLVPRRLDEIVETGTGGAYFDWAVGPEVVEKVSAGVGVVRPRFEAGDMLIFDDFYLHRTAVEPEMSRARYAIEMWSFAADAYPEGQVPLVW
jgi:hypothetical protein